MCVVARLCKSLYIDLHSQKWHCSARWSTATFEVWKHKRITSNRLLFVGCMHSCHGQRAQFIARETKAKVFLFAADMRWGSGENDSVGRCCPNVIFQPTCATCCCWLALLRAAVKIKHDSERA